MGAALIHPRIGGSALAGMSETGKRWRLCLEYPEEQQQIIPGLPDELACHILARTPRRLHDSLKTVSEAWKQAFESKGLYDIRKQLDLSEGWLYILMRDGEEQLHWYAMDPASGLWKSLPNMPRLLEEEGQQPASGSWGLWAAVASSGGKISTILKGWFNRRDFALKIPYCGCAAAAVNGYLYVLGGFFRSSSLKTVWRYDPRTNEWAEAAPLGTARAYCKTGLLNNKLYAVGGVSRLDGGLNPLLSGEVYDPATDAWSPIANMPFLGASGHPTLFWAEMLKPIATGVVSYRGKLCVPQSLYSWPFFLDVGGELYDPTSDVWSQMPQGMGDGWPSRKAGIKVCTVVNEKLYTLDPSSSLDGNKVRMYDTEKDVWKVVHTKVPILLDLREAESPYLLAGIKNQLFIITKDVSDNVSVLCADTNRLMDSGEISTPTSDKETWKTVASRKFGTAELVACQVIEL